ncbi:MAG: M23 family metallopeptidase [Chitinophagaceae bacterium]|nr:MAG: M23 family metallopeptidase [Chitinophagaceae bacterium]
MKALSKRIAFLLLLVITAGYLLPLRVSPPVAYAGIQKIDRESFWYYPWGDTGVHKGIDLFCDRGTGVRAPAAGIVIRKGYGSVSGHYLYVLGAQWRTYYFAHLDTIFVDRGQYVSRETPLGTAGNSGNAAGKPTHLHFSIETLLPYPSRYDGRDIEGWKKMFYLDPVAELHLDPATHPFLR